jgi:hypothetical protein
MGPEPKCNEMALAEETEPSAVRVAFLSKFRALGTAKYYPLLLTLTELQRRSECEESDVVF